tara:strand:+ start:485 stop:1408 length:924 start_codon:yes stop_codon:yes gene_type:complete
MIKFYRVRKTIFPTNDLFLNRFSLRNIQQDILTSISLISALIVLLPLFLVLSYVIYKGASQIDFNFFTQLPEPPGDDLEAGGVGNAIVGTFIVTFLAAVVSIPIGIGAGIYLAEYSKEGPFTRFIRFGTNVLSGVPSIIAGVFIYGTIVSSKVILGSTFSAIAGGLALSILMIPTIIKTTDEGLKLVPDDLRKASYGIGASKFITVVRITLPSASRSIATGIVLGIARASGETAPLIFTALFSFYWSAGSTALLDPIASLSVLIYNFALEPYKAQNELAWAASFILVCIILIVNLLARWLSNKTMEK